MNLCLRQSVGNTRFKITIHNLPENRLDVSISAVMFYFLESGSFSSGLPEDLPRGLTMSLEIAGLSPEIHHICQAFTISPGMMLQLLEILEGINKRRDIVELETMALALYSSSSIVLREKKFVESINFKEAYRVYAVVQEWKRSQHPIRGTFHQYTPEGISRHRFLNVITHLYNCSAAQLIYSINMQKAMNLLLTSGHSITAVSELSGYTNKENFITAFRNTYGVTPGYLRKRFR